MAQSVKTRRFSYTLCALRYALTRDPKSAVSFVRFALCAMRYALHMIVFKVVFASSAPGNLGLSSIALASSFLASGLLPSLK